MRAFDRPVPSGQSDNDVTTILHLLSHIGIDVFGRADLCRSE
jgi:hypothetical protein